jgi:putative intracellular protease/amidase
MSAKFGGGCKILIFGTNTSTIPSESRPAGTDLQELGEACREFFSEGFTVDMGSVRGGIIPIDPQSINRCKEQSLQDVLNLLENPSFKQMINNSLPLDQINFKEYSAVYFPGGHGPMFDIASCTELGAKLSEFYNDGGVLGAVCHGVCAFLHCKVRSGEYLIKGKRVTAFSNAEEREIGMDKYMPFLLEDELKKRGAAYMCAPNWQNHVVLADRLVTGQNPASTGSVASTMLNTFKECRLKAGGAQPPQKPQAKEFLEPQPGVPSPVAPTAAPPASNVGAGSEFVQAVSQQQKALQGR